MGARGGDIAGGQIGCYVLSNKEHLKHFSYDLIVIYETMSNAYYLSNLKLKTCVSNNQTTT